MASLSDWQVPSVLQPKPEDYDYDLESALASMVALRATVPSDAFTAETLGTERAGNGVIIREDGPALPIGQSSAAAIGDRVVIGGAGGRQRSVAARIDDRREFAGYWEYVLDEAIFTTPAHPHWGGTAL